MEVTGKIKKIDETKTYGTSGFRKREMSVLTNEQYPQPILIEFIQDKCDLLNSYNVDDNVKISINLRGRIWESPDKGDVYFNSIQGWRIEKSGETSAPAPFETTATVNDNEPDDLPF